MSDAHSKRRKRRTGLAAFRAVEHEVEAALIAGRTVLSIYDENRGRLTMSYVQFTRYVRRLRNGVETQHLRGHASRVSARLGSPDVGSPRSVLAAGTGPPKGRPEDALPTADMDRFAAQALKNKDLF